MAENYIDEATSLKGLFQGMVPDGAGVLQGQVISASPLQIQIVNDDKLVIGESITIVPKHLTNYTATVDIAQGNGTVSGRTATEEEHYHTLNTFNIYGATMTVYNALKVGETVHILSFNNGKKYYVLDRVN